MGIVSKTSPDNKWEDLLSAYAAIELHMQGMINRECRNFCVQCPSLCCKEHFCRESIDSPFLSVLVKKQKAVYHRITGWMSGSGCRLGYGRPPVCYDFFCDAISEDARFHASGLQRIVREFIAIGNKARGNRHLICVDDLKRIVPEKIEKMMRKIDSLGIKMGAMPL
jgi:hypothetical protein